MRNRVMRWSTSNKYRRRQHGLPRGGKAVCKAIIADDYKAEGALFGIGIAVHHRKQFPGIYAGVAHDNYACERLRLSNANVICMGER